MKRNWSSFSTLSTKEKVFRIVNLILMIGLITTCIVFAILCGVKADFGRNFTLSIVMAVLFAFPLLLELIFGHRLPNWVTFCFTIYIVLAGFLGSLFKFYSLFKGYDKVVHFLFGYVVSLPGIFLISLCQDYKKLNPLTIAFFCLFFSLTIEFLWEIYEFCADRFFHQSMQGAVAPSATAPYVTDTITDMMCNLGGALVFFIHFLIGRKTKFNLGIRNIERSITYRKNEMATESVEVEDKRERIEVQDDKNLPLQKEDEVLNNETELNKKDE